MNKSLQHPCKRSYKIPIFLIRGITEGLNAVLIFFPALLGSGDEDSDEEGSSDESGSDDESGDDEEENKQETEKMEIIDKTETNLVALRRLIYLTIQSRFVLMWFLRIFG